MFRAIFEKILPPLRTRNFSIPVGSERFDEPPFTRDLPTRKLLEQKLFQFVLDVVPVRRDTRHNVVNPVHVFTRHAEDQALGDGFVLPQRLFDGCRRHFPPGYIDVVAGPAAQINRPILKLGEIAGLKDAAAERFLRLRPISFAHCPASHHERRHSG